MSEIYWKYANSISLVVLTDHLWHAGDIKKRLLLSTAGLWRRWEGDDAYKSPHDGADDSVDRPMNGGATRSMCVAHHMVERPSCQEPGQINIGTLCQLHVKTCLENEIHVRQIIHDVG